MASPHRFYGSTGSQTNCRNPKVKVQHHEVTAIAHLEKMTKQSSSLSCCWKMIWMHSLEVVFQQGGSLLSLGASLQTCC